MRRWLAFAACVVVAGTGCRGDQGPVGGELSVRLVTPRNTDRGVVLVVTGRVHGVSAPAGSTYRVFADTSDNGDTAHIVVAAPQGSSVAAGEIARLRVDDTRQYRSYTARVLALATATYEVSDTAGVSASIARP